MEHRTKETRPLRKTHLRKRPLRETHLRCVLPVRKNKPQLPPALVSTRGREALSSKFAFTDTHSLVSQSRAAEHRKPLIILDYNRNKGGVDCLDKVM